MMDELTEALDRFDELGGVACLEPAFDSLMGDEQQAVIAAARVFTQGQVIRWCETHLESAWSPDECWKQVYGEDDHYVPHDSLCSIVPMRLCAERRQG